MSLFCRLFAVVILWLSLAPSAHADKRVALVIGNAGYESVPDLINPINDATAIGAALERLGFTVKNQTDLSFDAMRRALGEFAGQSSGADIAIIYYAGHGIEIGGQNYLIPVDARLATDVEVPYEAIPLSLALGALDEARGTRLLILDACRNNPFAGSIKVSNKSRSIGRGLARVEPGVGTIVAYAAKEGTTADDGDAEHSPFAKALLQHIEEPGIDVQFLFRKVRDTVLEDTNGNQEPFTYGSLPGKAVLLSPAKEIAPPPVVERTVDPGGGNEIAAEVAFWNTIEDTGDRALYESYLKQYPSGRFASLAGIFIARIDAEAAKPQSSPLPEATPKIDTVTVAPPESDPAPELEPGTGSDDPAATPEIGPLAALPPQASPLETEKPTRELIRNVQQELSRLGCDVGKADGVWGRKSRSAVDAFVHYTKVSLASREPSAELLAALEGQSGRVCPLVCSAAYEISGDRCVLRTCPSGTKMNASGICYVPPPTEVKKVTPTKPVASKKSSSSTTKKVSSGKSSKSTKSASSGCRQETVNQCIGRVSSAGRQKSGLDFDQIPTHCARAESRKQICR